MFSYAQMLETASTVEAHDYRQLEQDDNNDDDDDDEQQHPDSDAEGFRMSSQQWPKGPLRALLNDPRPPRDAAHAVQLYETALATHPTHPQAHVWCAQAARLCADDLEQALAFCLRSITLRKSSDGYYVLAHILLMQGYTKEAHLAAQTAYEIDAWRPKVQHALRLTQTALVDPVSILGESFVGVSPSRPRRRWCAQCDPLCPTIRTPPPATLLQCSRCQNASYCSKACQRAAWKNHKAYCETAASRQVALCPDTSPAHRHVLDGWVLPTLAEVATVFGASRDLVHGSVLFTPPTGATVRNPQEYERRATIANASAAGYTEMQDTPADQETQNRTVTAFRPVVLRLHDEEEGHALDAYRAARTAFWNVTHSAWDMYCDELLRKQVYVFLTTDYVDALAHYLQQRLVVYGGGGPVVEIGAGNGRLAFFLQQRGIPVVATDDGSWKLEQNPNDQGVPPRDVEIHNLSCKQALAAHDPTIVVCAWMPMYKDFSAAFCATPSVREYILIGPVPATGHAFETWGLEGGAKVAAYIQHGFTKTSLVELEKLQLCKTDKPTEMFASQTVSFRRAE